MDFQRRALFLSVDNVNDAEVNRHRRPEVIEAVACHQISNVAVLQLADGQIITRHGVARVTEVPS
jgi:hypothetical protein